MTMYYDPFVPCHHPGDHEAMIRLGPAQFIAPFMPDEARILFDSGIEQLGWRDSVDITPGGSQFNVFDMAYGMFLAREFGDDQLYAKISGYTETHNEPVWDEATGEFHWRLGLEEPTPRGQLNATAAMAEANSLKGWSNLFASENLKKFVDPTIHGVDFPTMCLSQASFDTERRTLVAASDAGLPANAGQSTTFRVGNVPPGACSVEIDGKQSSDWRAMDGEMEISTTVGQHSFVIRFER